MRRATASIALACAWGGLPLCGADPTGDSQITWLSARSLDAAASFFHALEFEEINGLKGPSCRVFHTGVNGYFGVCNNTRPPPDCGAPAKTSLVLKKAFVDVWHQRFLAKSWAVNVSSLAASTTAGTYSFEFFDPDAGGDGLGCYRFQVLSFPTDPAWPRADCTAFPPAPAPHAVAQRQRRSLEESSGAPNCQGCFNRTTGVCLLDGCGHSGPCQSCTAATEASCQAIGLEFLSGDGNAWPSGCLAQQAAKCEVDLELYGCGQGAEKYTVHANSTAECLAAAKDLGATHAGLAYRAENETGSFDCDAILKFKGGCVWAGWHYYDLATMEIKGTCGDFDNPPAALKKDWKCVDNKCVAGKGSLSSQDCSSNCGLAP